MKLEKYLSELIFSFIILLNVYASYNGNDQVTLSARIVSAIFLLVYYVYSVQKVRVINIIIILLFFGVELSFFFVRESVYGFLCILFYRILLFLILTKDFKLKSSSVFFRIASITIAIALVVMFSVYMNSIQYYLGILIAIFIAILLSLSFVKVLDTPKNGNLDMFLAILVLIFTEAIFSFNHNEWYLRFVIFSLSYHFSYFMITRSLIKKQQALEKSL